MFLFQFPNEVTAGMEALKQGNWAEARTHLEEATKLDSKSAGAWFLLASAKARLNDRDGAVAAAKKAGELVESGDTSLLYNLSVFFRDAGVPEDSAKFAERVLKTEDSGEVRLVLGQALAAQKQWPRAEAQFKAAQQKLKYNDEVVFQLSQAYMQQQKFPQAIALLEESRKTFLKNAQLELALGVAFYGARKFPEAVDSFLRVMSYAPEVPQPYYFAGRILEHAGARLPEVMARAEAFERVSPGSPLGFVLHAKALMQEGKDEAAMPLLEKALAIKEALPEVHFLIGQLLDKKKEYAGAAKHLERSVELNPDDAATHFRLARVYDRLGRKEDAEKQRALHEKLSEGTK